MGTAEEAQEGSRKQSCCEHNGMAINFTSFSKETFEDGYASHIMLLVYNIGRQLK